MEKIRHQCSFSVCLDKHQCKGPELLKRFFRAGLDQAARIDLWWRHPLEDYLIASDIVCLIISSIVTSTGGDCIINFDIAGDNTVYIYFLYKLIIYLYIIFLFFFVNIDSQCRTRPFRFYHRLHLLQRVSFARTWTHPCSSCPHQTPPWGQRSTSRAQPSATGSWGQGRLSATGPRYGNRPCPPANGHGNSQRTRLWFWEQHWDVWFLSSSLWSLQSSHAAVVEESQRRSVTTCSMETTLGIQGQATLVFTPMLILHTKTFHRISRWMETI